VDLASVSAYCVIEDTSNTNMNGLLLDAPAVNLDIDGNQKNSECGGAR
jgi:hypothetical protein